MNYFHIYTDDPSSFQKVEKLKAYLEKVYVDVHVSVKTLHYTDMENAYTIYDGHFYGSETDSLVDKYLSLDMEETVLVVRPNEGGFFTCGRFEIEERPESEEE